MTKLRFQSTKAERVQLEDNQWVEILSGLPLEEYKKFSKDFSKEDPDKNIESSRTFLHKVLVAWSAINEKDEPLPCTPENIDKLDGKTILDLSSLIMPNYMPEKKNLPQSEATS